MKPKITPIVEYFNRNYNTNNPLIIQYLTDYVHSSHCIRSKKMDGYNAIHQPSFPDVIVEHYTVYYDNTLQYNHHSGRIVAYFSDETMEEIGLFRFKKFLRSKKQYEFNRNIKHDS